MDHTIVALDQTPITHHTVLLLVTTTKETLATERRGLFLGRFFFLFVLVDRDTNNPCADKCDMLELCEGLLFFLANGAGSKERHELHGHRIKKR